MRKVIAGSMITAIAVLGLPFTTPSASAASSVEGTVTAISGTVVPATLTVQSGLTSYTVNVSTTTKLVRKYNGPATLDEFAVADLVQVSGTVTGTTIDATKVKNLSIQRKGASQWGKVLTVDSVNKTFTFDTTRKNTDDLTVTTSSTTKIFMGNREGVFTDIVPGMTVKVIGLWRRSLDTIAAERVLIKLTELEGTIKTVNCDTNVLTVRTKHGKGSSTWTVNISSATTIRGRKLSPLTCADLKVNHKVQVKGLRTANKVLSAVSIWDKSKTEKPRVWKGEIVSIDSVNSTFVIEVGHNNDMRTVVKTSETLYVNKEGAVIAFTDLVVGHDVQIWGTLSGTTVTSNLVMDKDLPTT